MPVNIPSGQKLRNSCDTCNLAKVKCSKGRPSCNRCEIQGVQCIYGISMRAGKHRAQASNMQKPRAPSQHSVSSKKESPPASAFSPGEKPPTFDPTLTTIMDTMPMTDDWSSMFTDDSYLRGNTIEFDSNNPKPRTWSGTFTDADFTQPSPDFSMDPSHLMNSNIPTRSLPITFPSFSEKSTPPSSTDTSASTAPTSRRSTSPIRCSCDQQVLQQLLNLTQIPDVPSMYDTALNQNKEVIRFCHSIFQDQIEHHHDISFVLTMTALIAKVISVYDTIYNPYRRHGDGTSSLSPPLTTENLASLHDINASATGSLDTSSFIAPVTHVNNSPFPSSPKLSSLASPCNGNSFPMRLSLGTYMLDEKDEEKLKWDIFKMELSKVSALVNAFEQRFCDGATERQMKYEAKAYEDMVYYLQKRLRLSMQPPKEASKGSV